ncbi:MAG TPA: hypothetical protein PLM48_06290 [Clostridia bacterium]|nr:hypothetical protein [Clostridia bacterium]
MSFFNESDYGYGRENNDRDRSKREKRDNEKREDSKEKLPAFNRGFDKFGW